MANYYRYVKDGLKRENIKNELVRDAELLSLGKRIKPVPLNNDEQAQVDKKIEDSMVKLNLAVKEPDTETAKRIILKIRQDIAAIKNFNVKASILADVAWDVQKEYILQKCEKKGEVVYNAVLQLISRIPLSEEAAENVVDIPAKVEDIVNKLITAALEQKYQERFKTLEEIILIQSRIVSTKRWLLQN